MAPEIVAKRLVEHLERAGFVIMKRPPMTGGPALGQASELACWALVAWTCSAMAVKPAPNSILGESHERHAGPPCGLGSGDAHARERPKLVKEVQSDLL